MNAGVKSEEARHRLRDERASENSQLWAAGTLTS